MKVRSDRRDDVAKFRNVPIVEAAAGSQFPDAFDGVEVRAVRRQEMEDKLVGDLPAPRFVQVGVVIASIADDHDNLSALPLAMHSLLR